MHACMHVSVTVSVYVSVSSLALKHSTLGVGESDRQQHTHAGRLTGIHTDMQRHIYICTGTLIHTGAYMHNAAFRHTYGDRDIHTDI